MKINKDLIISDTNYTLGDITKDKRYSTKETFTGKYWINGKPIYRKTFEFFNVNIKITDYNWTKHLNLSNISYITVDETHSYFVITGQRYPINYSQPQYNSGASYRLNVTNSDVDFIFYKTNNFSVTDIVLTVEYVKNN